MALEPIISVAAAEAHLDALDTLLGASATLTIYAGTVPANCAAAAGTALAVMTAGASMFAAAASADNTEATMDLSTSLSDTSADATGTATYYRLATSGGTVVHQGTVGIAGSDLNLSTTAITAGDTVTVSALTLTQPTGASS
jgi:uncharacterized glyoxalase superfamily protein PhnB